MKKDLPRSWAMLLIARVCVWKTVVWESTLDCLDVWNNVAGAESPWQTDLVKNHVVELRIWTIIQ